MEQTGGRVLFVYYKVDGSKEPALLPLVKNFQQQLLMEWPHLSCELMQRPAASGEVQPTWMEIYRHGALSDKMIDGIARLACDMQLPSPRFSEIFAPLHEIGAAAGIPGVSMPSRPFQAEDHATPNT